MNKTRIIFEITFLIGLAILFLVLFWHNLFSFEPSAIWRHENKSLNQACFNQACFKIEIADTVSARARGLMFRDTLPEDQGMLFIFDEEGEYPFWMKNTLMPLDIIWLDQNQKIVFINKNTPPCAAPQCPNINPQKNAKYVLEINGGLSDKIGLQPGEQIILRLSSN